MRCAAALVVVCLWSIPAVAQTQVDGIVARIADDIVTQSDVRQARLLKLVQPGANTDQAWVDAIVNRRLMLTELKRNSPAEPAPEAIDAKRRAWEMAMGAGANVPELLARAGMSEIGLRGWLRDDLRIHAYLDGRFGDRTAEIATWIASLRQRAGIK